MKKNYKLNLLIITIMLSFLLSFNNITQNNNISKDSDLQIRSSSTISPFIVGVANGPVNNSYNTVGLDPIYAWDVASFDVTDQVVEGLFAYNLSDPDNGIIPRLASALGTWNPGADEYTVPLRTGVKFHDGTDFNASAVVAHWDRMAWALNTTGTNTIGITQVAELYSFPNGTAIVRNVVDNYDNTVTFFLNGSYVPFEALLAFPASYIQSPTYTDTLTGYIDTATGDIVGTGPFVYDSYEVDVEVLFHAFEDYWKGKANITDLVFKVISTPAARDTALLNGNIHFLSSPSISILETLKAHPNITVLDSGKKSAVAFYLGMNNNLINKTFREAISYAINYSYIIEVLREGYADRMRSPIPEGIRYSNTTFNVPILNLTHARMVMQSMGFGGGFNIFDDTEWIDQKTTAPFATFNYTYNIGNTFRESMLVLLQDNLGKIGINITDAGISWQDFLYSLYEVGARFRDQLELWSLGWGPDYNDPSNYINNLFTNRSVAANGAQYNGYLAAIDDGRDSFALNDNVQLLMEAAIAETDPVQREIYYDRIQELLIEQDFPWAWLYVPKLYHAHHVNLTGFQQNALNKLDFYSCQWEYYIPPDFITNAGVLKVGVSFGPSDLDPIVAWDTASIDVIDQVVEGLFAYNLSDPDNALIPRLASALGTWNPGTDEYTVPLRTDVKFHDGTDFNASAVVAHWDRLAWALNTTGTNTIGITQVATLYTFPNGTPIVDHVVDNGDNTVTFHLNDIFIPFEALLAFPASYIQSPTYITSLSNTYIDTATGDIVGTGPFVYDNYEVGVNVTMHQYESYWAGVPNIDELTFSIIEDTYEINQALLDGTIDFIKNPDTSRLQEFRDHPNITLVDAGQDAITRYLGMNNRIINVSFRKAISYAINYTYIIDELLGGEAVRLRSPIPMGITYANWSFTVPILNLTRARQIMQSMGFGEGFNVYADTEWINQRAISPFAIFNYTYNTGNTFRESMLVLLQDNLGKIGINVTDAGMTWEEFLWRYSETNGHTRDELELYFIGWGPDYNDPSDFINPLFTNRTIASNGAQYNGYFAAIDDGRDPYALNDNVQLLMEAAIVETDPIQREKYYDRIQELLIERDFPWVWGFVRRNYDAYSSKFTGFQSNPMEKMWFYPVYSEITTNYTLTSDIFFQEGNGLIIGADGIYIDGNGYKIIGSGTGSGILIEGHTGIRIKNVTIQGFDIGISIYGGMSPGGHNITSNYISDNNVGILLSSTFNNVTNNIIARNNLGVNVTFSSNYIYRNLLINNDEQMDNVSGNIWVDPINDLGNFWSNYWGEDDGSGGRVVGDYIGDTDLPHEGVDNYPLLDPSIPELYGPLPYADWWMVGRGGSPVIIQAEDPYGRIISLDVNEIGLNAFYVENDHWKSGEDSIMILIAINPEAPVFGTYTYEITATEDTTYSFEWFSSALGNRLYEQEVNEVFLATGETDQVGMNIEEDLEGDVTVTLPEYTFGGILKPINPDNSSVFKLGRTIPVKFQIIDDGSPVSNVHATLEIVEEITEESIFSGKVFWYDEEAEQYIFTLSTEGLEKGVKYRILIELSIIEQTFAIEFLLR